MGGGSLMTKFLAFIALAALGAVVAMSSAHAQLSQPAAPFPSRMPPGMAADGCLDSCNPSPYFPMPAWDQQLPVPERFFVLQDGNWSGQAVLDRETGLVWEATPDTMGFLWASAMEQC